MSCVVHLGRSLIIACGFVAAYHDARLALLADSLQYRELSRDMVAMPQQPGWFVIVQRGPKIKLFVLFIATMLGYWCSVGF